MKAAHVLPVVVLSFAVPGLAISQWQSIDRPSLQAVTAPASHRSAPASSTRTPGTVTVSVTKRDSVIILGTRNMNDEVRVIVRFKGPRPAEDGLSAASNRPVPPQAAEFAHRHSEFGSALATILAKDRSFPTAKAQAQITREFSTVLDGVAATVPRWALPEIRQLDYVQSISDDLPVHATPLIIGGTAVSDTESVADSITGKGVRIGLLDTGVDYMHSALGGGFGTGFKVVGGYDFVNSDADPMDDNGHGTRLAGLMVGWGETFRGMAPGAELLAFKVLDNNGDGLMSNVLAGIEHAVDPDMNPATADGARVLLLPLTCGGNSDDPLSQAVQSAVANGVVCVVAAGDGGPGYQTIGSPASAPLALAVGACGPGGDILPASSRGPAPKTLQVKPDLVARGSCILSTAPGGGYEVVSGTAVAAANAAGAAALMRERFPGRDAGLVQAALANGARDLGRDLWTQGAGEMDVVRSLRPDFAVLPGIADMGLDDRSVDTWIHTAGIYIVGDPGAEPSYTVRPGTLPPGVSVAVKGPYLQQYPPRPIAFSLEFTVNNSQLPLPASGPPLVSGTLIVSSPHDTVSVPFAFAYPGCIDLEVTGPDIPSYIWYHRYGGPSDWTAPNGYVDPWKPWPTKFAERKILPEGLYSVMVICDHWPLSFSWIVRDSVQVKGVTRLSIDEAEACYRIGAELRDELGRPLDSAKGVSGEYFIYPRGEEWGMGISWGSFPVGSQNSISKSSRTSSRTSVYYYLLSDENKHKRYTYSGMATGIAEDHVITPGPGKLKRHLVEYRTQDSSADLQFLNGLGVSTYPGAGWGWGPRTGGLTVPFQQEWFAYETFRGDSADVCVSNSEQVYWYNPDAARSQDQKPYLLLPDRYCDLDGTVRSSHEPFAPLLETRGERLIFGLGPKHWYGRTENLANRICLTTNTQEPITGPYLFGYLTYVAFFVNQMLDFPPGITLKSVYNEKREEVSSGPLADWDGRQNALPVPGVYTVKLVDPGSHVYDRDGTASVYLTMDTRLEDRDPPGMLYFNILRDGEYTDLFMPGQHGTVEFRLTDNVAISSVNLFYRVSNEPRWRNLPFTGSSGSYAAALPDSLPEAFISLRVVAKDRAGNSMDYRAEPAFHMGLSVDHRPLPAALETPAPGDTVTLYSPPRYLVFRWHPSFDPDLGDPARYSLHVWGPNLDLDVVTSPDTSSTTELMKRLSPGALYHWQIMTVSGKDTVLSDTAVFSTSSAVLSVSGKSEAGLPREFALRQNYPNPFNPSTAIRYALPTQCHVVLGVYNSLGQKVAELVNADVAAGYHEVRFNASHLASGIYFYRLQAGSFVDVKKLVFAK